MFEDFIQSFESCFGIELYPALEPFLQWGASIFRLGEHWIALQFRLRCGEAANLFDRARNTAMEPSGQILHLLLVIRTPGISLRRPATHLNRPITGTSPKSHPSFPL